MTLFPKTLSRGLLKELGAEYQYPNYNVLLDKLSTNHGNLLTFFQQAIQSEQWCKRHSPLLKGIFVVISVNAIKGYIPIESVMSACIYILKFNITVASTLFDFDFTLTCKESNDVYCRLFIMRGSNVLRQWFLDRPNCRAATISEFANFLENPEEFEVIYKYILTEHVSYARTITSTASITRMILQCREWKLDKLQEELQRQLCTYVNNYITAIEMYGAAVLYEFKIIKEFCENYLEGIEFYQYTSQEGYESYSYFTVTYLQSNISVKKASFEEFIKQESNFHSVRVDRVDISFIKDAAAFIGLTQISAEEANRIKIEFPTFNRSKLSRGKIERIILNGKNNINNLYGMLAYYHNIQDLNIQSFAVDIATLLKIGELKPKLKCFSLTECTNAEVDFFSTISVAFPFLTTLYFYGQILFKSEFESLLIMPHLNVLALHSCTIEHVDTPALFSRLRKLLLSNILFIERGDEAKIDNMFQACNNVVSLTIENVAHFKLASYPYPEMLTELTIDCGHLETCIEGVDIPVLKRFIHLNNLYVLGQPNQSLRKALLPIIKRLKVGFSRDLNNTFK